MDHLTERQIADFAARTLSPAELLTVDDHLQECPSCRDRLLEPGRLAAGLTAWREATSGPPDRLPAPRRWLLAAAVVLATSLAAGAWWARQEGEPSPPPSMEEAALGKVPAEVARLPAAWRRRVEAVAAAGRLEPSASWRRLFVAEAATARGGSAEASSFALLTPIATAVRSDRPELCWAPLPGATDYEIAVFDSRYRPAAEGRTTEPCWIPAQPLTRGELYSWRVTARRAEGEPVISPRPPAPEARFAVLAAGPAAAVERGERRVASPLARAVLYADAGLADESAGELAAWIRTEPGSPLARRLLASLNAWRPALPPR